MEFKEVRQGYKKEEVDTYVDMLVTEYEAVRRELKIAKEKNRILKKKKKQLEEKNKKLEERSKKLEERGKKSAHEKENITYQETIAAAMMGAEASGKWIVEEAKKEAFNVKREARREVSEIKKSKKEALREVKSLTRKLQIFLKETQGNRPKETQGNKPKDKK